MSYDLFASVLCRIQQDVDDIFSETANDLKIPNIYTRIKLLTPGLVITEKWPKIASKEWPKIKGKDYTHNKYKELILSHTESNRSKYVIKLIEKEKIERMHPLDLWIPDLPNFSLLPSYSAFIQFEFTLTRPYLSRDDETFYINDNPVRKDKIFKVPMVSGANWKGNLRWTMMKTDLEPKRDDHEEFSRRRLRHTMFFGTEKGFTSSKNWEKFLDHRCTTDLEYYDRCKGENEDEKCRAVRTGYCRLLCEQFGRKTEDDLPHVAGWLRFYPTFFDSIGLEVINPHDRRTRAGKNPIYFESVPIGAKGTFSLLYVPLGPVTEEEAREDLKRVTSAIYAMMLLYGFSAKKTSGFGEASEAIKGFIQTSGGQWPLTDLGNLKQETGNAQWA